MTNSNRLAALDVGSNTVKVLIVERGAAGQFIPLFEEAHSCRLGEGISRKRIKAEAIDRALNSIKYFLFQCRRYDVSRIVGVGTAAIREASNASILIEGAARIGIQIETISGEEEARLSYVAVRNDPLWRGTGQIVIVDIGGGSTEMAWGEKLGDSPTRFSLPIGAVRLTEQSLQRDPPNASDISAAEELTASILGQLRPPDSKPAVIGVGGTCSNLGAVAAAAAGAPDRVHGRVLTLAEIESQIDLFASLPVEQRKSIQGLDPSRADVILAGAVILREATRCCGRDSVQISLRGLRWGLLYDRFSSSA